MTQPLGGYTHTSDGPFSASSSTTLTPDSGRDASVCRFCQKAPAGHPVEECEGLKHTQISSEQLQIDRKISTATKYEYELFNWNVMPNLRLLLGRVLREIDVAIPNKDQNRAIKDSIRDAFDEAYFDIQKRMWPDCGFESGPGYAVTPEVNRAKAFDTSRGVVS